MNPNSEAHDRLIGKDQHEEELNMRQIAYKVSFE